MSVDWKRPFKFVRSLIFIGRSHLLGFGPPGEPGLDEESMATFFERLGKSRSYLEFGSGGTTLAAARAGVATLSVEADRFFAKAVRQALPSGSSVEVIDVDLGLTKEWSTPLFHSPTPDRLARWRHYIEAPFERIRKKENFPDFVLIDGRFRRACALKVVSQAHRMGAPVSILVDDYFTPGREHYHQVEEWLGPPRRVGRAALFDESFGKDVPPSVLDEAARDWR